MHHYACLSTLPDEGTCDFACTAKIAVWDIKVPTADKQLHSMTVAIAETQAASTCMSHAQSDSVLKSKAPAFAAGCDLQFKQMIGTLCRHCSSVVHLKHKLRLPNSAHS